MCLPRIAKMFVSDFSCSWSKRFLLTLGFCLWAITLPTVHTFNYSPVPNLIINDPKLKTFKPQTSCTQFGISMVMRPTSIFIGAPRAQSTLESQRNINETGAIYRCSLQQPYACIPYVFENRGNINDEISEYTYDSEQRNFQKLGASMDGGTKDTDKLIVCAPMLVAPTKSDYLMHGICYWVNNTLAEKPVNIKKMTSLRLKTEQVKSENKEKFYYYMLAEQGFSAHISPDNEEFIIGAPGLHTWKGSVIRYRKEEEESDPSLSRRDTLTKRIARQTETELRKFYKPNILNPATWDQPNDSYFGYAVSSGYFDSQDKNRLLYLATAPQAHSQDGEAYLFDMNGTTITKYNVFRGSQFGEYFGYSILAEDINNDDLTDVVISAPQYSINGVDEDGAIYVFINQGGFDFKLKVILSPEHGKVRFGTTLSTLGDINRDGFRDIAVGAPFAGNGSVFIYLGTPNGLRDRPSQRLDSPSNLKTSFSGSNMYGHGLAKGVDIDGNGFNDLAVGAPNAEAVMVYRAYPVVKIIATVSSQNRELKPEDGVFQLKACYSITTTSSNISSQALELRIVADPRVKRVRFTDGTNEIKFTDMAELQPKCRPLNADVKFNFADIFKPIELEIHYHLVKAVPNSEKFCENCAAVDPDEPKVFVEKIIFNTGCASDICVADLQVKSLNKKDSFILGSSNTIKMTYEISNMGETAYLPQINFTSSNAMPFAKIPSNCKTHHEIVMLCDLNNGRSMTNGAKITIEVLYDSTNVGGESMKITAEVFSTGKEKNPGNNKLIDFITLKEFTDIEVVGTSSPLNINLEKTKSVTQIISNYEVKSIGPSTVSAMEVVFSIPVAYRVTGSTTTIPIIDEQKISIQAVYDAQLINIDFYENKTQIIMNAEEYESSATRSVQQAYQIGMASIGKVDVNEINAMATETRPLNTLSAMTADDMSQMPTPRRRRHNIASASISQYEQVSHFAQTDDHNLLTDDLKASLPINRTIVFSCRNPKSTVCVSAVMRIYNFKPEKPITINMKYQVNLKEINQILIDPWEIFVVLIDANVQKLGKETIDHSLAIKKTLEHVLVSKYQLHGTPIWLIILAILGGLLLLALITFGMYKLGFFHRAMKAEREQLMNEEKAAGDEAPETANLNLETH